ncbi:MAG: hypothetical protein U0271_02780 [Polyangiaceae bacterium]
MSQIFPSALFTNKATPTRDSRDTGIVTNQQIVAAAESAYQTCQVLVDALAKIAASLYVEPALQPAIQAIDAYDWSSPNVHSTLVAPVLAAGAVRAYLAQLVADDKFHSLVVGVADLTATSGGNSGMGADLTGTVQAQDRLDLPNDPFTPKAAPTHLAVSIWTPTPAQINGPVYGLEIGTTVDGTSVLLRIVVTADLSPYGFIVMAGLTSGAPNGQTILGGTCTAST